MSRKRGLIDVDSLPKVLTLQQAAEEAAVSVDFLRDQINNGRLPAYKAGRTLRVRADDLAALFPRVA